ncbi:ESF1 homolog [Pygocentrus nattereri]|uniref:NUC153 domain-containing protein n=1 Tax=Pygocentrus nattereri TaxID=42514 RepID=A0A3B4CCC6_PYGNA|nr:ESF1 homolog [Pygocentrus nattereri]XP_017571979.2 ESF1 homolog [Pygocentrus nattereri]
MSTKKELGGDDRFGRIKKDPRFWEIPDVEKKVRIDKRFQSMFHDERFKLKYTVDKRGRPVSHTSAEDLKRFYKLSDSEGSDGDEEEEEKTKKKEEKKKKTKGEVEPQQDEGEESLKKDRKAVKLTEKAGKPKTGPAKGVRVMEEGEEDEDDDEEEEYSDKGSGLSADDDDDEGGSDEEDDEDESDEDEEDSDSDSGPDLARGKGNIETSSEEEEEEEEDYLRREEEEIEHDWGEMWKDAPRSEEMSRRLAVCNMNWDRIKAKDLLALLNSFKPKDGVVLSVMIYPSEFGKERMKAEQTQGPLELTCLPDDPDADTEEQRIYREKVRDYQFKRLRYYYAVVECDSVETATKLYEECDGFEYESSCSTMDLRFIPDDVTFDEEPKDRATDVDLSTYQPKLFSSTATTTAKVELTWDETDHDRVTALSKKFSKDELLDMDFKAYLASSSEDEEFEEEGVVQEEETTLAESSAKEKRGKKGKKEEEQIAKYRELLQGIQDREKKEKDKDMEMEITWVPGLKETTEKLVKKKLEGKDKLTPWEEFLEKKKEKKKEKRKGKKDAEAEAVISDDELPPDVDLNDPFFSEELDGSAGASQKNKKTKKNKKGEEHRTPEEEAELEKQKAEMALLMEDDDEQMHHHFNYDKIVEQQNLSKKKQKKLLKTNTLLEEDNFQVDVQDPRFQAMFTSHLYNLDPSDPAYKKTKATQSIVEEKQRRREEQQQQYGQEALKKQMSEKPNKNTSEPENASRAADLTSQKVMDPSLSMLIKSVKNKTEQFQARKKQRTK